MTADPAAREDVARPVVQRLKRLYMQSLRPIENEVYFEHFQGAPITESEMEARPQVLLIGQYSTGKSSLIRWLTGVDSPFFDIQPQPSTDKFMAFVHGDEERAINGDAATCLAQLPFQGLSRFGASFLTKFQAVVEPAEILERLTFVDTPGVLAGGKQRVSRGYDFPKVCKWFAQRADLILLLFDAHKLDISDEFREVIEAIRGNGDKVRCVLNKADQIDGESLMRVSGALMWNLGQILRTPEVCHVYISSFWDQTYKCRDHAALFDRDKQDLMEELRDLPRNVAVRRINEVVARARAVKVQMAIGDALRARLPACGGLCGARRLRERQLRATLEEVLQDVAKERGFSSGDLPQADVLAGQLAQFQDFSRFPRWSAQHAATLDHLLDVEIPALMALIGGVSASSLSHPAAGEVPERERPAALARTGSGRSSCACWLVILVLLFTAIIALLVVASGTIDGASGGLAARGRQITSALGLGAGASKGEL